MPNTRPAYPAEFRRQMVDLVRAGRDPTDLAREFEPARQTIQNWVAEADRSEGRREAKPPPADPSLTATERDELARLRREVRQLKLKCDIFISRDGLVCAGDRGSAVEIFRFMSTNRADFPIAVKARTLGVSKAGYYAWIGRPTLMRKVADATLLNRIRTVHLGSHETCGAPRVQADLRARGERHFRKRIARLMREAGLIGACHRRGGPVTTRPDREARPAPDLVDRVYSAEAPNRLWVADITCVPTASGFLYLAVVLEAFSRRIVRWAMAHHLRSELVLVALEMAVTQRRPHEVIHHSDRGSQYTSLAFGNRCLRRVFPPSMGSVGDAYDNAMAESFFSTLECELLARFRSRAEARMAVFSYIEGFYNPLRLHSALGYRLPVAFKQDNEKDTSSPALIE